MDDKIEQWFKFFEYTGNIYAARYMYPVWNAYPKYYEDVWDSLCIFLEGYAFERQGASPNYHHAAIDSLLKYKKINEQLKSNEAPKKIWENFCKILNNDKLNELRNPLLFCNSEKSPYSVITIAKTFEEQTFSEYFATQIKNDKIKDAHNKLKEIRGVNDKIASFYLRDLVCIKQIDLSKINNNRDLLQPIDTWVKETCKDLFNNNNIKKTQLAECITKISLKFEINPEKVNMGMWFFGSNIVESKYRLKTLLKSHPDNNDYTCEAKKLLMQYIDTIKEICRFNVNDINN